MDILYYINPLKLYQDFLSRIFETFVNRKYTNYRKKTSNSITSVKEMLYKAGVYLVFFTNILCISICMYVIFYYTYIPNLTYVTPVHLQFKSCDENMGVCSYPSAHVQLTRRSQMLMSSQPYRVKLVMEVPETQINKDLGMFMACAEMRAAGGAIISSSCRSAMLTYRSEVHQTIRTLMFAPLLIFGASNENQVLQVELISDFEDNQTYPVTNAYVELQSRFVQVQSCELHIEAHFTGLRYYMYHWPKMSAFIGICSNLFFVSLLFILGWQHLQDDSPEYLKRKPDIEIKYEKIEDDANSSSKAILVREDSLPFVERNFQDLEISNGILIKLFFVSFMSTWSLLRFVIGLPEYINVFIKRNFKIEVKNEKTEDDRKFNRRKKVHGKDTFLERESLAEDFKLLEKKSEERK